MYYFLLITLAIFSFCNLHIFVYNCCIFLCYYIQIFPLCYFIGIFWHIFMSVNPFIHKYMALCVLKRNLIPEYLLSWFFFPRKVSSAPCNIRFHYLPCKYSHHVLYSTSKRCIRVSDNFASKSAAQRNENVKWFSHAKERDAGNRL